MIIKEKRWLSRFVAMLCVLTMVVGVLTPASVGVAANTKATKITMNIADGLEIYDSNNLFLNDPECVGRDYIVDCCELCQVYYNKLDSKNELIFEPMQDKTYIYTGTIVLYVKTTDKPEITFDAKNVTTSSKFVNKDGLGPCWEISFIINGRTSNFELTISEGEPKYTITFPAFDDSYEIKDGSITGITDDIRSCEVSIGEYTFEARAASNAKDLIVKSNGTTIEGEDSNDGYKKYKLKVVDKNITVTFSTIDKIYSVTLPTPGPDAGYSVMANSSLQVTHGGTVSFYVSPEKGYKEPTVTIDNNGDLSKGVNNLYVINNITGDIKVNIKPEGRNTYKVHFISGIGYTITKEDGQPYDADEVDTDSGSVKFKVVADPGYEIKTVTANGDIIKASLNDIYSINVTENTIINVTSQKALCDVSYDYEEDASKYTVTGQTGKYEYGTSYTFYVTPAENYEAPKVTVNEDPNPLKPVNGTQYVINITRKTVIHIKAGEEKRQTITFNTGVGYEFVAAESGEVLSSSDTVSYGTEYKFKVNLKDGYKKSKDSITVTVNNIKITPQSDVYTIPSVKSDQIVSVSGVQKDTYTVTLKDGDGYSLTATDGTKVTAGDIFRFKVNVKEGYSDKDIVIKVDENERKDITKDEYGYYSVEVNKDIVISVDGINIYTYSATMNPNEHVNKLTDEVGGELVPIDYGKSLKFKVVVEDYYHVVQVAVDGVVITPAGDVYTVPNITGDPIVTVTTAANELTVNYVDEKYPENNKTIVYTTESYDKKAKEVNSNPNSVYQFLAWKYDGEYGQEEIKNGADIEESLLSLVAGVASKEITLTASWGLNEENLQNIIKLTTEKTTADAGENKTTVTFKTMIDVIENIVEGLPLGEADSIKVTGLGTLFSTSEIDGEEYKAKIKEYATKGGISEGGYTRYKLDNENIYNYYYQGNYELKELDNTYFKIFSKVSTGAEQDRHGLGWIELDVNGEKMILMAKLAE